MNRILLFSVTLMLYSNTVWSQIPEPNPEQWHRLYKEGVSSRNYIEYQGNENMFFNKINEDKNKITHRRDEEEWYEPDTIIMYNPYWEKRDIITYNKHGFKDTIIHQEWWYGMNNELETYARSLYQYNEYNNILSLTGQVLLENGTYDNYQMFTYNYDIRGNQTLFLSQYWNGQSWGNDLRIVSNYDSRSNLLCTYLQLWDWEMKEWSYFGNHFTYTYDTNNNRLTELIRQGYGTQLENNKLATYTYNENNYNDTIVNQKWNKNGNIWENDDNRIYEYDSIGKILNGLRQIWINEEWVNNRGTAYVYDDMSNLLSLKLLFWQNNIWINDRQYIYSYDSLNNMLSDSRFLWNESDSVWSKWNQLLYTYNDANYLLTIIWQEGLSNVWFNKGRMVYEYDDDNNQLSALDQSWENNTWKNDNLTEYKYDEHGNCLSGDFWEWKNNGWETAYSYGLEITYNRTQCTIGGEYYCNNISASYIKTVKPVIITDIEAAEQNVVDVLVYPNPTTGEVRVTSNQLQVTGVEIFDVFGRLQKAESRKQNGVWIYQTYRMGCIF